MREVMTEFGPHEDKQSSVPSRTESFVAEIRDLYRRKAFLSKAEILEITTKYDQDFIGNGAECVVVGVKGRSDAVAAFTYEQMEPYVAKEIFYLSRILSTLFPHNFPRFYASFSEGADADAKNASRTIRRKVIESEKERAVYPFNSVLETCRKLGIDTFAIFDSLEGNLAIGEDGGVYYLDTVREFDPAYWDMDKIAAYMEDRHYDEKDQRIVRTSLGRLQELYKQKNQLSSSAA